MVSLEVSAIKSITKSSYEILRLELNIFFIWFNSLVMFKAIPSPISLHPSARVNSSLIDDELFAWITASLKRLVNGEITIDELPVSLIDGKTIL